MTYNLGYSNDLRVSGHTLDANKLLWLIHYPGIIPHIHLPITTVN